MAHEIDNTAGIDAIAYVGKKPWHGLGQELQPGADIETWKVQAGLDWTVMKADVKFDTPKFQLIEGVSHMSVETHGFKGRSVLYRSDTLAPLSVMSTTRYHIVQPAEILAFFADIARVGGFEIETAGALKGGKKIWALAKVGTSASIIGRDIVRPYVLIVGSFDGSTATTIKYICERVVCANTLAIALDETVQEVDGGIVTQVKYNHSKAFDAEKVRNQLGIVHDAFDKFVGEAQALTSKGVSPKQLETVVAQLIGRGKTVVTDNGINDVRDTRGYKAIVGLFEGVGLLGGGIDGGKNAWRLLNATTQYVDHTRGKNRDSGLDSAWFGDGSRMKSEAKELLLAL